MLTLLVSLGCVGGVVVVVGGRGLEVTPHQSERSLPICARIFVFAVIKHASVDIKTEKDKKKERKPVLACVV